ncbi:hypothetical protein [Bacillus cereus]|uniref:Uncharacterized protein n=1 Tax=Bacillus cereus TaxID=1396 RepID=A0A9X7A147_BACCE|nr:hypothetical protein [Bacillus cereus]PFK27802.1 hypothetical protein COI98_01385 [Bacillus cereus]
MGTGLLKQSIFVEYKTRTEIMGILKEKQVSFCERRVQKLFERYTVLLQADHENDMKVRLAQIVEEHRGIILSIDGV